MIIVHILLVMSIWSHSKKLSYQSKLITRLPRTIRSFATTTMDLLYLFEIILLLKCAESARILAVIFSPSHSHQIAFRPLWKELSERGHEITLLTTDPMKDSNLSNIKEIDLSKSYETMEKYGASDIITNVGTSKRSLRESLHLYMSALSKTAEWQLEQPEVKNIIQNKSEHFDLIMIEVMYPTHLGFVDRFNVPFIGLSSMDAMPRIHRAVGNFMHSVIFPDLSLSFTRNLTFFQRISSVLFTWGVLLYEHFVYKEQTENARKYFGEATRPLNEIEKDMSMLFINVNPVFHHMRPLGPNTISIGGGTHLRKVQQLPKDLQYFLDNAKEGVIYFSLGTNVKSSLISDHLRSVILEVFTDLPYKIIWKFEEETFAEKPKNVKILKWVPQQDLFAHPNVKLFITQCGLQSMEESIYNHVPMVGMPFYGDQHSNARIMEDKGFGISLNRHNLTKEIFQNAILEVLQNPIYRNQVKDASTLARDVEMTGLEKAVWWTEYTIRTHGAKHLINPTLDLPFYKYYLLDVIGFVLSIIILFLFTVVKIMKYLTKLRHQHIKND